VGFDRIILGFLAASVLLLGADKAGVLTLRQPAPPEPAPVARLAVPPAPQPAPAPAPAPAPVAVAAAPATAPAPANAPAPQANPDNEDPSALPAGAAQEVTFYTCTACHSTALITRSGLARPAWDELMDWMVARHGMTPLEPDRRVEIVDYLAEHFPPRRRQPAGRVNPFATN
jgi:cytochrome c5